MSSTFEQAVQKALSESKNDLSFPFDPFKLPLSSVYLQSIYRSWEDVNDVVDDDEDDDDDPQ
jgi:RNA polymerase I-specific transcription initiation factor RRN3